MHIVNPNDPAKPTVAQIYRIWQDANKQRWINACWYYHPYQTVHHVDKRFFENEVVKTGQYRDHMVQEIVDRCFVMFITRYNKGRPRGLPTDKTAYVCEARYNEENRKFNKIKTWASCLPDEVRERDYEMDLFDMPRQLKKNPSPIKHLLPTDAKETDPLPRATYRGDAPPLVGAVHKRPRDPNVSGIAFFLPGLLLYLDLDKHDFSSRLSFSLVPSLWFAFNDQPTPRPFHTASDSTCSLSERAGRAGKPTCRFRGMAQEMEVPY